MMNSLEFVGTFLLQLAVIFEICLAMDAGIVSDQQIIFVTEIPCEPSKFSPCIIGNAREAKIESSRFD